MEKTTHATSPYIYENSDEIGIIGEAASFIALGEMLIQKAKLGSNMSATFVDGEHKPIKLILDTDLLAMAADDYVPE